VKRSEEFLEHFKQHHHTEKCDVEGATTWRRVNCSKRKVASASHYRQHFILVSGLFKCGIPMRDSDCFLRKAQQFYTKKCSLQGLKEGGSAYRLLGFVKSPPNGLPLRNVFVNELKKISNQKK
jgi:hypothetical protein